MTMPPDVPEHAYATLITRASYLAGVILLAHSLKKHGSKYPFVVMYTRNLPGPAVEALQIEGKHSNIIPVAVDNLNPGNNQQTFLIAARFADTWTKLRVFSESLFKYDKVCFLDADMMVFNSNMDAVFDAVQLPGPDWLAATQTCCCNLDRDPWAPADYNSENCPYTPLQHPDALNNTTPVPKKGHENSRYADLNGGMFIFKPSPDLWESMMDFFNSCDHLSDFKFPDQDFLAEFFEDKWASMPWCYNAIKTHRYWHPNIWRDDSVVCLHYIVDKPWAARMREDGTAGYKGRDGETHRWWWEEFERWKGERVEQGENRLLEIMEKHVAKPEGEEDDEDMKAIGSNVQGLANNKKADSKPESSDGKAVENGHGYKSIYGKKPHAERGHGPVVHD